MSFLTSLFGSENSRALAQIEPLVERINALEPEFEKLTNEELKGKTAEYRSRLSSSSDIPETLNELLPEAFATVREAAKRTLGQRHFDVQLIGGIAIHQGKIAEMRTGEGKTLVATLPVYLNALTGKGVHVVTVNDYLARRDAAWMGEVYNLLGLTSGVINSGNTSFIYDESFTSQGSEEDEERDESGFFKVAHDFLRPVDRKVVYEADITYGTNSEFGFDYLRDNLVYREEDLRQRNRAFAIIDEIDSVLIDEARTPLIISAPSSESEELYKTFASIARSLVPDEDYLVDEKKHAIQVTESGIEKVETTLGVENLYAAESSVKLVHHLENAVRARALYLRDREYVVQNNNVVIVDQSTGRLMPTRRWSDGLHQAVEAKEGVEVQRESRTYASITYQNFFRMYDKLGGMTGTAKTSEEEFFKVYGLEVLEIPTNKPIRRIDHDDLIFQTREGKFRAVARKIKELNEKGQPVLVGTVSVENNELLSTHLKKEGIEHSILNAKHHEEEGEVIARAGTRGAVTIATNMAGRGVDIKLGGDDATDEESDEVRSLGGLFVLGTEKHSDRRIDNQLRGRSGRQGDPGETQFFVSLDDDLMRVFGGDRVKSIMGTLGIPEDEPIQNKMITRSLENAQTQIEGHYFDARKNTLSYDDVLNTQRRAIYARRLSILTASPEELIRLITELNADDVFRERFEEKKQVFGEERFLQEARRVSLQTIDMLWVDHLESMDYLRSSVGLRGYGQRDPLVEYKKEGLVMFRALEASIDEKMRENLSHLGEAEFEAEKKRLEQVERGAQIARRSQAEGGEKAAPAVSTAPKTADGKAIGRNDKVRIKKGEEEQVLKYKKAEPLLSDGWVLVGVEEGKSGNIE